MAAYTTNTMKLSITGQQACRRPQVCRMRAAQTLRTSYSYREVSMRSMGDNVTGSFLDLAKLISSSGGEKGAFEDLAYGIGKDVYVDLNGWHVFMKDLSTVPNGPKMNTFLSQQIGPDILSNGVDEQTLVKLLKGIPIKLGGNKTTLSLFEIMPSACVQDLVSACKDFLR